MKRKLLVLLAIVALLTSVGCATGIDSYPAWHGVPNLDRVDENVYRGAQPTEIGMQALSEMGVKTIINLRQTNDVVPWEVQLANSHNIFYTNVPMSGLNRPTDEQIQRVLSIIETAEKPVFIHCKHGKDRTGTIVACYRIKTRNWSSAQAQQEADEHGMSIRETEMKEYIRDFGQTRNARR